MPRTSDPSYLQPLHQFRPTKPSHGFSGTGLGRFGPKPKTPGRFQTYLLFTMYSEQASILANDANVFSSKGYSTYRSIHPYRPEAVGHHWPARAERSGKAATASAHNHTNRVPRLVELSGIEPLTPACKAGALPAELQPQPSQTPDSITARDQANSKTNGGPG